MLKYVFLRDAFETSGKTAVITTQWTTNPFITFSTDSLNRGAEASTPSKDAALMTALENNAEVLQETFFVYIAAKGVLQKLWAFSAQWDRNLVTKDMKKKKLRTWSSFVTPDFTAKFCLLTSQFLNSISRICRNAVSPIVKEDVIKEHLS